MRPPHRNKRLMLLGVCALTLSIGVSLLFTALRENTQFFIDPSVVVATDFVAQSEKLTIGGLVEYGSVQQGEALEVSFRIHDFEDTPDDKTQDVEGATIVKSLPVSFDGILPSLFREGQGIVIVGALNDEGVFIASEVLAKHDENYRPKT